MASTPALHEDGYRRDLGDGLLLRWSSAADADQIAGLYADVFRMRPDAPPNSNMSAWGREMLGGGHPHIGPSDFALVEDMRSGEVVAATCLLRYLCAFDGISFWFGRPEAVATRPAYRRRGLIRAIFELAHAKSEALGDLMQGITGIPYYYRQFGYEYAVQLGQRLTMPFVAIPAAPEDAPEPYTLRRATSQDLTLMGRLWEQDRATAALSTMFEEAYWRWVMLDTPPDLLERWFIYLIMDQAGTLVGYLLLARGRWSADVAVSDLVIERGVALASVVPSLLRGVRALADVSQPGRPNTPPASGIAFRMPNGHPLRLALDSFTYLEDRHPYAWYIRVPDLPRFIRHIAPALERRLAASPQAGYSGELTLDFYRGGLRLAFERGALTAVEDWRVPEWGGPKAAFPPLVFLKLLCGYRSLEELRVAYPDVWAEGDGAPLLEALFPKRASHLLPLD